MALVYSVNGVAGARMPNHTKTLIANLFAEKWSRVYSSVAEWGKVRMALDLVLSNTLLLRGSRARYS